MLEPNRIQAETCPDIIYRLGNNTYYYNYDIQEIEIDNSTELEQKIEIRYTFIQVLLRGQPDYRKCIQAVIRQYLSTEDELSLINKYNRYLAGLDSDSNVYKKYLEYVTLVSDIQQKVKSDFGIQTIINEDLVPTLSDITNLAKILIKTSSLTDQESLQCKSLYPLWESYIGKSLSLGDKISYKGSLYKARQDISQVLDTQFPSIDTASLYEEIVQNHAGTLEDPIPYNNNMSLELDKYYIQNNIIYLCTRSTGQAVYSNLSDLVGIYVTAV